MSKFKVGDKVKVIDAVSCYEHYIGKTGVITKLSKTNITFDDGYILTFDDKESGCILEDHELELVEPKPFTKSDLKDGMVVEYRYGWKELVLGEKTVDDTGSHSLCNFDDNLINKESRDSDIMRVYTVNNAITSTGCIFDPAYLNCIWERKEEPKHKMKYLVIKLKS